MSPNQRIGAIVAAVAVLVVGFFVFQPDDEEEPPPATQTVVVVAPPRTATAPSQPATTTNAPPPAPATTTTPAPPPPPPPAAATTKAPPPPTSTTPRPQGASIRVRGGQPVGGVKEIEVTKGDDVVIVVSSRDTSGEVHLHGYDLTRNLQAGGRVSFAFTADADGIYEIELEGTAVQIGKLVVQPG